MTKREAFDTLRQDFYTLIAPYTLNTDPDMHSFCLEFIETKIPEFDKSLQLNKLPQANYMFAQCSQGEVRGGVKVSDFGSFSFFFEILMEKRFQRILDEEMEQNEDNADL